jgi:hypothetical protein
MEAPIEIRYAGVVVGRAQELRSTEGDSDAYFIALRDPMPVGTLLRLRSGDQETPARVVRAIEASDATASGMQVRVVGEAVEVPPELIPPPAPVVEKSTPVAEAIPVASGLPHNVVPVQEPRSDDTPEITTSMDKAIAATAPDAPGSTSLETAERRAVQAPLQTEATTAPEPEASTAEATTAHEPEASTAEATTAPDAPSVGEANPPAAQAAAETASAPPSTDVHAVPQAVPVAVGSSMTGALENAAESVPVSAPIRAPMKGTKTRGYGTVAEPASDGDSATVRQSKGDDGSAAASGSTGTTEELPPARPISGPSTRRKTRRRKQS